MDIMPHNLFYRYPRPRCLLLDSRDSRLIRRRNVILLHPQQGTRISFEDFYMPTVPVGTIPKNVASHSTGDFAGIAATAIGRGVSVASKSQMSVSHFVKLIERACETENCSEGVVYLKQMVSAGYVPNRDVCTKLLNGLMSISKALEVMGILEKHGLQDVVAYNSLLAVICKNANVRCTENVREKCIAVMDRMQAHGCSPDLATYNIVISTLCCKGELDLATEVLDRMLEENQCQPSLIIIMILFEASFRGLHNDSKNSGGITRVIKLLEKIAAKGRQLDNDAYNYILREMFLHGFGDQTWQLTRTLRSSHQPSGTSSRSRGFKPIPAAPDLISYNIFIKSLCMEGRVDKAIEVLDAMMDIGLKPDTHSYHPIIKTYCRRRKMDFIITFMEHIISRGYILDISNYNVILGSLCKSGAAYQALEVLDKLEKMGCHPNAKSYNVFISWFWENGDRTQAVKMLSQMVDKGIHPTVITYNTLISCLSRDGMVHHAIQLMRDMEDTWGYIPTVIPYNAILSGLCKAYHIDAAFDIFDEMVKRGRGPNQDTYKILVRGLARAGHVEEARKLAAAIRSGNAISSHGIHKPNRTK